jgi:hypothetical protein
MKLKKENFKKSVQGEMTAYSYECKGINFFIETSGGRDSKKISVYKEVDGKREDEFNTSDSLEAWNHFEKLLEDCSPEQGSSGGFAKNPQENPNILPLLAIKRMSDGKYSGTLFAQLEDKTQISIFDFVVDSDAMPSKIPNDVFVVNWSEEEVNMMLKCEIVMKEFDIVFEEDKEKKVFLFIPKSIVNQGGEKGGEEGGDEGGEEGGDEGGEEGGDEGGEKTDKKSDKKGKGEPKEDGEPTDEKGGEKTDKKGKGTPTDEEGEPTDEEGEEKSDKKGKGKPTDKDGEPTDEDGEPIDEEPQSKGGKKGKPTDEKGDDEDGQNDEDGEPSEQEESDEPRGKASMSLGNAKVDFGETIQKISEVTGVPTSNVVTFFRTQNMGESFLRTSNFNKIKQELNLPNITPKQLSEQIINSKKN